MPALRPMFKQWQRVIRPQRVTDQAQPADNVSSLTRWKTGMTTALPFLRWFPLRKAGLQADAIAGITVAMVLIPQSMAYAQIAGLPVVYGLYAAFIPVIISALWGSSAQLHSGPTAMLSLLTAAALVPLAAAGSPGYIELAVLLALLVGILRLLLGLFKLGVLVNFISHPVIIGFTNAAALIIGLSQLSKLLNVPTEREASFIREIAGVVTQVGATHLPTLAMGLFALALVLVLKRTAPRMPAVLIAVVITTLLSWLTHFEHNTRIELHQIADTEVRSLAQSAMTTRAAIGKVDAEIAGQQQRLRALDTSDARNETRAVMINAKVQLLKLDQDRLLQKQRLQQQALRTLVLTEVNAEKAGAPPRYAVLRDDAPPTQAQLLDDQKWRISSVGSSEITLMGGGQVIGTIPSGMPAMSAPHFDWDKIKLLLPSAFIMALIGFMEAISISKAIAARTKQRVDTNRELVGQGLGNIVGSFFQSFTVSGSFSRSALNAQAGAQSGLAAVISALAVVVVLLFLTPLLYHLPQAVLAVVVMLAVSSLINFKPLLKAWRVQRQDAIAGVVTFVATLALAPHLEQGILWGAGMAIVLFLFRTMKPRIAVLSRHADGSLRDARANDAPISEFIVPLRMDRSLYFANVAFFEDAVLHAIRNFPKAKYLLLIGDGINEIDASGEEMLRKVQHELRDNGIELVLSGLKKQVLDVLQRTGLDAEIGKDHFFWNEEDALTALNERVQKNHTALGFCPIKEDAPKPEAWVGRIEGSTI